MPKVQQGVMGSTTARRAKRAGDPKTYQPQIWQKMAAGHDQGLGPVGAGKEGRKVGERVGHARSLGRRVPYWLVDEELGMEGRLEDLGTDLQF